MSSDTEIELYEEVIENPPYQLPYNRRSYSPITVARGPTETAIFHGPISIIGRTENEEFSSTGLSASVPRPTLRFELPGRTESTAVVTDRDGLTETPECSGQRATLAPNVGRGRVQPTECRTSMTGLFDVSPQTDWRPLTESLTVHPASSSKENDRPRSAPASWMAAITASVNSLWRTLYRRQSDPLPVTTMTEGECIEEMHLPHEEPVRSDDRAPSCVEPNVSFFPTETDSRKPLNTRPPDGRIWRLDSDTEIQLDAPYERRVSPELDLRVPPRRKRVMRTQDHPDDHSGALKREPSREDGQANQRASNRDRTRSNRRPVGRETVSRQTNARQMDQEGRVPQQLTDRSVSRDRNARRSKDRPNRHKESSRSMHRSRGRHRSDSGRVRDGGSPPSSDDDGDHDKDSSNDRHRKRNQGQRRPRRQDDSSPDSNGDGSDDGDSSDEEDNPVGTPTSSRHCRIKLQKFDGTGSWESWWAHFENCAAYNRWTNRDKLAFMKGALTGNAAQVLWDTDRASTGSLRKLISILKSRFSGEQQAEKYRAELQIRRRKPHESLTELHQDIRRLMALAYPRLTAEAREEIACDHFTSAFSDPDFALKVKERAAKSLDEALNIALRLEAWAKSTNRHRQDDDRSERPKQKIRATAKPDAPKPSKPPESNDRIANLEAKMSQLHEDMKRLSETANSPNKATVTSGKTSYNSPSQKQTDGAASAEERPRPPPVSRNNMYNVPSLLSQTVSCWGCGLPGHVKRFCPMNNQRMTGPPPGNYMSNRGSGDMKGDANVYIKMKLFGKEIPCLVDSGCDTTLAPKTLADRFRKLELRPSSSSIWAANNTPIQICGKAEFPFILDGRCLWTTALISEDVEEVMLGIDWLGSHNCVWDFKTNHLTVDGYDTVTVKRRGHFKCRRVLVQETHEIPPRSEKEVMARVTILSTHEPSENAIVDAYRLRPGLYVGRTLLPEGHRDVRIRLANTTSKPQSIPPNTFLGQAVPVSVVTNAKKTMEPCVRKTNRVISSEEASEDIAEPVLQALPTDLSPCQRKQVVSFLREFDDMFSRSTFDMGRTTLVEHSIDTGNQRPIRQPLRRHPRAHLEEIDRQVDELLQNGFIEPAASPWASNVVLVRKKDGSFRLCVDYRQLNSVTYKDSYPLPHIDTCLSSMNGAVWFSTLDLRSGYHNIPIREADRDKTAFITRRGCFRYRVMPFGLTCAPSVFQRLMDLVLCGLTYETCLVYLDDIIVFSRDFESHLQRLREVFLRLRAANLKVHIKKCSLFQRRVNFLGHVLTETGIEVQPEKVETVQKWPTPRNLTELRSFVGLCSYYRRFISGFANLAAPLHALTRKNARFSWGSEQEEAFEKLKEKLTTAPILGMPRDEGTYYLDTDASDIGLGAVLSQEQDGEEVVLAYASRIMSRAEQNYDVTRRELLAVVFGLKIYRQYLLGREFVIRTDHSALQSLRKAPEPIGQQARWQSFIEQFNFEIRHRPGTRHLNADALSRRPTVEKGRDRDAECRGIRTVTSSTPPETRPERQDSAEESMAKLQQEDPDIGPILQLRLRQVEQPPAEEVLSQSEAVKVLWGQWHSLVLKNEVLYRKLESKNGRPSALQLVVPAVKKAEFIGKCHQGMTGGHRAFRSTLEQVKRRGFWIGWRKDVQRYCRQCQNCSTYHRGRLPHSGPLQPLITGNILERFHVDITGPHPQTPRGSKYILTCVDSFSKWAEAFAIPNKEAKTVSRILVEQVFCRLGTPVALLTDNAGELDGRLMQEICQLLDIDKQRTSFYRPETNSVAERFHATLNSMMGRMISDHQKEWDLLLPHVMAAYRASVHQSTGYSPNYLMFGREVRAPVDLVFGIPAEDPPTSYDSYTDNLEHRMKQAYHLVRSHLGTAAERMKRQYDLRVRPQKFHRGQWVLYYNPRKFPGKQQKWQRKFSPHLVVKELPPVNYLIQKSKRSRPFIAHVDKLKTWETDTFPKSWLVDEPWPDGGPGTDGQLGSDRTDKGTGCGQGGSGVTGVPGSVNTGIGPADGVVNPGVDDTSSGEPTRGLPGRVGGQHRQGATTDIGLAGDDEGIGGSSGQFPGRVDGQHHRGATMGIGSADDNGTRPRDGDLGNSGVGDGPRRYTCGPNDGARPRRYTFGQNDDTDHHNDDDLNNDVDDDDDERSRWTPVQAGGDPVSSSAEPRRTGMSEADQSMDGSRASSDDAAIAGDPMSALRPVHRPRRTVRRPARFKEFYV